jgi:hypothetical protein
MYVATSISCPGVVFQKTFISQFDTDGIGDALHQPDAGQAYPFGAIFETGAARFGMHI